VNSTVESLLRVGVPYEQIMKYFAYTRLLDQAAPPKRESLRQVQVQVQLGRSPRR